MAASIEKTLPRPCAKVISLADWRNADLERRRAILAQCAPGRMPSRYPGNDFNQFGHDLRLLAKELRKSGCKPKTAAGLLDLMSTAADLACMNVRVYESRAMQAERLLEKHGMPVPVQKKERKLKRKARGR